MSKISTKKNAPCGLEPYDKEWGVGVSGMGEDMSPFPRINRYRAWQMDDANNFDLDARRAELVTEAYKLYKGETQIIKMAKVLRYVMEHYEIAIYPEELIVGEAAAPRKYSAVFPEFSYKWVVDELKNYPLDKREIGAYRATDPDVVQRLLALEDFWNGESIEDRLMITLTDDEKKGMTSGLYFLNLYSKGGIGHLSADYERILKVGLGALKAEIAKQLAAVDSTTPDGVRKQDFYRAGLISLGAMEMYILRYAKLAREMAGAEHDDQRKNELLKIAEICEHISVQPAHTFHEALQLQQFITIFILIESNGHSVSNGRFDQYLYPYYEHDIETGTATKEEIQELIEYFFLKMCTFGKLRDRITVISNSDGRGMGGECLTVGGVDIYGHDASNDLTYMCLDAHAHTRVKAPWLLVRLHSHTPHELMVKTANVIRIGTGQPKIFNDEAAIQTMLVKGASLQDARNYHVVGCVELDVGGKEYGWHDSAYYNIAQILEFAVNDGKWFKDDTQMGPQTGYLKDMGSFDELLEAYEKQLQYFTDRMVCSIETVDMLHQQLKPLPYVSMFMQDCIGRGKDISAGGAIYNYTGPQASGIGTLTDGLCTIKQLVFEEKKISGEDLVAALKANWEGYQPMLQLVNSDKVHHYGNNDDYADDLAQWVFNLYCSKVEFRPNSRGGFYTPGVYTVSANIGHGMMQWASPEGRVAHEPISDCVGPVHTHVASHDVNGPTAMLHSLAKLDHVRATNGTLLNWKFDPSAVSGETGRDDFVHFLEAIVDSKIMHSQFNIVSRATLEDAQAHPENYKSLLVRVAGYSAFFVTLGKELQRDIIERTAYSFD